MELPLLDIGHAFDNNRRTFDVLNQSSFKILT